MREQQEISFKRHRIVIITLIIVVLLLCLVPIPQSIKDGGSTRYEPLIPVYSVVDWNGMGKDPVHRTDGFTVDLFSREFYDSFREVEIK